MGHNHLDNMGRRKIDIAYLTDDRVRKVTFCKRKGGLFKKADDLSKLCGVEVAVIIVGDKKTCEYASTDMNRIIERYRDMQSGGTGEDTSETSRLWEQLETQRRELEALTRELAAEKRQVEQLRGSHSTAPAIEMAHTNEAALLPIASLTHSAMTAPTAGSVPSKQAELPVQVPTSTVQSQLQELVSTVLQAAPVVPTKHDRMCDNEELSDDTAEVEDSGSEGTSAEEPAAKRIRIAQDEIANIQQPIVVAAVEEGSDCRNHVVEVN